MQESRVRSLGQEDPLDKGMTTHSSVLAWITLWTEVPSGLQSLGMQRIGHDWATKYASTRLYACSTNTVGDTISTWREGSPFLSSCAHVLGKAGWAHNEGCKLHSKIREVRMNTACQHLDFGLNSPQNSDKKNAFLLFNQPKLWYLLEVTCLTQLHSRIFSSLAFPQMFLLWGTTSISRVESTWAECRPERCEWCPRDPVSLYYKKNS